MLITMQNSFAKKRCKCQASFQNWAGFLCWW